MSTVVDGTTGINRVTDGSIGQADLAPNVAGNGPCFSASRATPQSATSTGLVPVVFDIEEYDTGGAYDIATGKFQPTVAGYYQIHAAVAYLTADYAVAVTLLKNGSIYRWLSNPSVPCSMVNGGSLVYLNGTTDYVQIGCYSATPQNTSSLSSLVFVSGFLARAA